MHQGQKLSSVIPALDEDGIDLLAVIIISTLQRTVINSPQKMLQYDPQQRISAAKALQHAFFTKDDSTNSTNSKDAKNKDYVFKQWSPLCTLML